MIDLPILKVCTLEVAALNTHLNVQKVLKPKNDIFVLYLYFLLFNTIYILYICKSYYLEFLLIVWFSVALSLLVALPALAVIEQQVKGC